MPIIRRESGGGDNYIHPLTHPATIIVEDADHRFITDAERTAWNAKSETDVATLTEDGLMSSADKVKMDGIEAEANKYVHPNHSGDVVSTGDGATVIGDNKVSNAKLADVATQTVKGRVSAGAGDPEDLTMAQLAEMLLDATTTTKGVVELATVPEAQAGTDATRAVTPVGALAAMQKYGLGASAAISTPITGVNWDTFNTSGVFPVVSGPGLNAPNETGVAYSLYVSTYKGASGNVFGQLAIRLGNDEICFRRFDSTWSDWKRLIFDSASASVLSIASTSTDDATSTTSAPLKSSGGGAVAKGFRVGDYVTVGNLSMLPIQFGGVTKPAGTLSIEIPLVAGYKRHFGRLEFTVALGGTLSLHMVTFSAVSTSGVFYKDIPTPRPATSTVVVDAVMPPEKDKVIVTVRTPSSGELHVLGHVQLTSHFSNVTTIIQSWEDA